MQLLLMRLKPLGAPEQQQAAPQQQQHTSALPPSAVVSTAAALLLLEASRTMLLSSLWERTMDTVGADCCTAAKQAAGGVAKCFELHPAVFSMRKQLDCRVHVTLLQTREASAATVAVLQSIAAACAPEQPQQPQQPLTPANACDPANAPPPWGSAGAAAWQERYVATHPNMPSKHTESAYSRVCACFTVMKRRAAARREVELQRLEGGGGGEGSAASLPQPPQQQQQDWERPDEEEVEEGLLDQAGPEKKVYSAQFLMRFQVRQG